MDGEPCTGGIQKSQEGTLFPPMDHGGSSLPGTMDGVPRSVMCKLHRWKKSHLANKQEGDLRERNTHTVNKKPFEEFNKSASILKE